MNTEYDALIPVDASDVEKCWLRARWQTSDQLPIETALSIPVPVFDWKASLCLSGFYYGTRRGSEFGITSIEVPVARLITSYPDGKIVSFQTKSDAELFPGMQNEGFLGVVSIGNMSPKEHVKNRKDLYQVLSDIIPDFSQTNRIAPERKDQFLELWNKVVEEPLIPFYQELNPAFFHWLEGS